MDRSKLYEWLLDNNCPWDWETYDYADDTTDTVTLIFSNDLSENPDKPLSSSKN